MKSIGQGKKKGCNLPGYQEDCSLRKKGTGWNSLSCFGAQGMAAWLDPGGNGDFVVCFVFRFGHIQQGRRNHQVESYKSHQNCHQEYHYFCFKLHRSLLVFSNHRLLIKQLVCQIGLSEEKEKSIKKTDRKCFFGGQKVFEWEQF